MSSKKQQRKNKKQLVDTSGPEWLAVCGYDGYYVSSEGVIVGPRGYALAQTPAGAGYVRVSLYVGAILYTVNVHKIVAIAFLPAPTSARMQINHKNGIKLDNRAENLEWVTALENVQHALRTGLRCVNPELARPCAQRAASRARRAGSPCAKCGDRPRVASDSYCLECKNRLHRNYCNQRKSQGKS